MALEKVAAAAAGHGQMPALQKEGMGLLPFSRFEGRLANLEKGGEADHRLEE
jgi:hypothetical protein